MYKIYMVDRYWREIESVENDIENAMQISSILLKLKGYDKKLEGLSKINDNSNNISSNSGLIDSNINAIKLVNKNSQDNRADISTNLGQISNIKNDLSDFKINYSIQNLFIYNIDVEKNYTLNKDNPKFSIFSYNLEDDFKSNSILEFNCKILYNYTTYNNIGTLIHVFKLYDKNNELIHEYKNLKSNSGDNLSAYLNQNDVFYVKLNENYSIIKIELILSILDNISKSVSCKLLNTFKSNFLYVKHYKKINTLSINNNLTDLENDISSNLTKIDTNKGNISSNLTKIDTNKGNISSNLTKIDTNKGNISSNSSKIDTNKNDISTNLININTNEDNIAYNLNEINYLKNNKPTQYLKNIYNILFYDEKTQIDFRDNNNFYEKEFDVNASINDFIEIKFKIELEYQDTDDRHYVKSIYEIFDENNDRLYIKTISNNEYNYFSNKLIIDENIFYTFIKNVKKMKLVIRFQKLSASRLIKIFYMKNNNYTLTIKNYGL